MSAMATPTTDKFLSGVAGLLRARDALQLQQYILVEPPLPDIFSMLKSELRQAFPDKNDAALERKCSDLLPEDQDGGGPDAQGSAWPGFVAFMREYLEFLRDVDVENLLEAHELLSALVNQCITALSNATMGIVVLPTCLSLSAALAKLAVNLDRRPELTAHLLRRTSTVAMLDDAESSKTLAEGTAELLQRAFTTCLTDRSAGPPGVTNRSGRPEGKKVGIYTFANLVLKLLFQCRKTRLASQVFTNVAQHSPPLAIFPASQRVSYLYYLGRFAFSTNHFYRAQLALEGAYSQCHARCLKQRSLILTYLISANLILGRFPSDALLQRPEAADLGPKFWPLRQAIVRGDLAGFKASLAGEHQAWFLNKGLLLPLRNRCEVLVWRSLARRTFVLNGVPGGDSRKAPTFSLQDLLHLAQVLEQRSQKPIPPPRPPFDGRLHTNHIFMAPPTSTSLSATLHDKRPSSSDIDSDLDDEDDGTESSESRPNHSLPTIFDIESILASLIDQGLLHGFLSHKLSRFAIIGANKKPSSNTTTTLGGAAAAATAGPLPAGFPPPWRVLKAQARAAADDGHNGDGVPGWVKDDDDDDPKKNHHPRKNFLFGPGSVVHLKGARPVGVPPAPSSMA